MTTRRWIICVDEDGNEHHFGMFEREPAENTADAMMDKLDDHGIEGVAVNAYELEGGTMELRDHIDRLIQ